MGKKGSSNKGPGATSGPQMSVTMREASTGKKLINVKSSLKLQHLKDLAVWASHVAAIPSLGAFFGHRFAASSEALGSPVDPSLLTCQRCESMLHPGFNCTIRIEKNKTNTRHKGKKTTNHPRNNIVYTCNFCFYRTMKRGTSQNTSRQKDKAHPKSTNNYKSISTVSSSKIEARKYKDNVEFSETFEVINESIASAPNEDDPVRGKMGTLEISKTLEAIEDFTLVGNLGVVEMSETLEVKNDNAASSPATPLTKPTLTLLDSKRKNRNRSAAKKTAALNSTSEAPNASTSNRRRRKSWTSLKEIAKSNEKSRRLF